MKTVSYAVLAVPTAILTAHATSDTDPVSFAAVDLDGAIGNGVMNPPRTLTMTLASHAGSYIQDSTYVVTGKSATGQEITETFTIPGTAGGVTLSGTKAFSQVTQIDGDPQTDTDGAVSFGVQDVVCDTLSGPEEIRVATSSSGHLKVGYPDGTTDIITNVQPGEHLEITPSRIYGDSDTTVGDITLFFGPRRRR